MKVRSQLTTTEAEEAVERIKRRLERLGVPTLPAVAVRIMELVESPSSSFKDFADVLKGDQAMTGRLLRMANSAYFAQAREVTSIERAMLLIGQSRLKALVLGFHLTETADGCRGLNHKSVWTQSVFRAWLAHSLAEEVCDSVRGEAFIVGLLADAGLPLMPALLGEEYHKAVPHDTAPHGRYMVERERLAFTHVDVAAALCSLWNLPETLAKPIRLHHDAPAPAGSADPACALRAIGYYVGTLDLEGSQADIRVRSMPKLDILEGLTPARGKAALQDAAAAFKASRDMFSSIIESRISPQQLLSRANAQLVRQLEEVMHGRDDRESPAEVVGVGAFNYAIEPATGGTLRVIIFDQAGAAMFEDRVRPRGMDDAELIYSLLLDAAPEHAARAVLDAVRRLAA